MPYRRVERRVLSWLPAVGTHLFYGGDLTVRRATFMIKECRKTAADL
jgi:hypothetical protein